MYVCVYPLSHGGVVIRRVPPVPAYRIGATKRHVVKREGESYEGGKSRAHFIIYVSTLAREGTGTFAHFIRA